MGAAFGALAKDRAGVKRLGSAPHAAHYPWALSMVRSRALDVGDGARDGSVFVPLVDMCNHKHEGNTAEWRGGEGAVEVVALTDIAKGGEVTLCYAERETDAFVLHMGEHRISRMTHTRVAAVGL